MRVYLDACVDPRAVRVFAGHEVRTAFDLGWHRLKDNHLLPLVQEQFDVFVTADRSPPTPILTNVWRRDQNRHGVAVSCCILLILDSKAATAWRFSFFGANVDDE